MVFLESKTLGLDVFIIIFGVTKVLQDVTKCLAPSTSTTQTLQSAGSLMSFKKHRVGIMIPAFLVNLFLKQNLILHLNY